MKTTNASCAYNCIQSNLNTVERFGIQNLFIKCLRQTIPKIYLKQNMLQIHQ